MFGAKKMLTQNNGQGMHATAQPDVCTCVDMCVDKHAHAHMHTYSRMRTSLHMPKFTDV
jgi:hypothetical protein